MNNAKLDVAIIGGGVIGVCTAYYLTRMGREVTIFEQAEIGSGSSFGNAGLIVPGYSIPLAHPGALGQGLRWMLRRDSPFYVRARMDWDLMKWLWKFWAASNDNRMREGLSILSNLGYASLELLKIIVAEEHLDCEFQQKGWLMAYLTQKGLDSAAQESRLLNEVGVKTVVLDQQEMFKKEPGLRSDLSGGVYFPNEAHLNPDEFVQALARKTKQNGTYMITGVRVTGIRPGGKLGIKIRTTQGDFLADQVVLATGAWTSELAKDINTYIPLQAAKGYSVTIPAKRNIKLPLYLSEAKVAVTPLRAGIRLAGTLELTGMDLRINHRRVDGIVASASKYLQLPEGNSRAEPWSGLRPCTPDGLPIIGRVRDHNNLYIATGHCMLGMTLGPVTGKLIAQLMCDEKLDMSLEPFSAGRF